jgi:hypothetical protein
LKRDEIAISATSVACFRMPCVIRQCKKQLQHRRNFRRIRNVELIEKCLRAMRRYLIYYLQKIAKIENREIFGVATKSRRAPQIDIELGSFLSLPKSENHQMLDDARSLSSGAHSRGPVGASARA